MVKHEDLSGSLTAERYILGELTPEEREQFEEHFFECPQCAMDVRDLSRMAAALKQYPAEETASAKPTWLDGWRLLWGHTGVSVAATCGLLLLAGTTAYQTVQTRRMSEPRAVTSFLLRPETRGEATAIPAEIGPYLLLEADVPGASGPLRWEVTAAGTNARVAGGASALPAAGSSLKLLLLSRSFAQGRYLLTIRPDSESGRIWQFPFEVRGR